MTYTPHEGSQTHISVKLKFWFFKHYWWLLCIVIVLTCVILIVLKEPITAIATVIGALLSLIYFLQKQELEELLLFRELFKEFNARYDELNEQLARILESKEVEISAQEKETLVDYFNLCGEEYLYYTKGYIDPSVWEAWFNGMKVIFSNQKVQCVWSAEKKTGSYYGLPLWAKQVDTEFFHREDRRQIRSSNSNIMHILTMYI